MDEKKPQQDMSRATQTKLILGAIGIVAFIGGLFAIDSSLKNNLNDPYRQCASILGHDDACKARVAAARLRGGY